MIADEIQSGLGRTGTTFAVEHENVVPDVYILGKALGGGIMPVSAVVADEDVLGVFKPGQHGSTFGGNPLACAIAREVIAMLKTGEFQERSRTLGAHLHERLGALPADLVREVRGRGLWAGRGAQRQGAAGQRAADGPRRARQGDPRDDDPARPAADRDRQDRPRLGARPAGSVAARGLTPARREAWAHRPGLLSCPVRAHKYDCRRMSVGLIVQVD